MEEGNLLSWLIIVLLLLAAWYFAVAETSFASVSRIKIKTLMDKGDVRAKRAMYVLDNFDRAITTILIGTNVIQLAIASMVTVIVTREFGVGFVAISTIITTMVVFFAGEMLPKSIGKKKSEHFALATAGSLSFLMKLLGPLATLNRLVQLGAGFVALLFLERIKNLALQRDDQAQHDQQRKHQHQAGGDQRAVKAGQAAGGQQRYNIHNGFLLGFLRPLSACLAERPKLRLL